MTALGRFPQLDGLRAVAMCGVLYVHLFNPGTATEHLRVSLFFVISGFLITHVLLAARDTGQNLGIHRFYIRRALRLFPALLILVLVAFAFDMDGFRASALWHAGQMSNIFFSITAPTGQWHPWVAGHLWSLNIVEQFYLAAPFLVIYLTRRQMLLGVSAAWVVTVFIRVNADHMGPLYPFVWNVLCYDPIFAGVIARLLLFDARLVALARARIGTLLAIGVMAMPLFLWADYGHSETYRLLMQPALALIVMQSFLGYPGIVGAMLSSRPALFLARISYGVYIYHLALWWMLSKVRPEMIDPGFAPLVIVSSLSIIVATLSYHLIERPIARLKSRFPVAMAKPISGSAAQIPARP